MRRKAWIRRANPSRRISTCAPRKAAATIYLPDGISRYDEQLKRLGPHTTGVGCLYIKDLDKIDISILENIVAESYPTVTAGTYGLRASRRSCGAA
jgi:hypothetical protein